MDHPEQRVPKETPEPQDGRGTSPGAPLSQSQAEPSLLGRQVSNHPEFAIGRHIGIVRHEAGASKGGDAQRITTAGTIRGFDKEIEPRSFRRRNPSDANVRLPRED